jgi:DNA gyrase subunit B
MPELIERGHIFIAQPPLYKAMRSKSETYLKDERALEDYLIGVGLDGAVMKLGNGSEIAGDDLRRVIEEARLIRAVMAALHSRYDRRIVEQAAIAGALTQGVMANEAAATEAAAYVARRLDAISEEMERGWTGSVENGGFVFRRTLRGVTEAAILDPGLLNSAEARKLDERTASLQEFYTQPARLLRRNDDVAVSGPLGLFDAIMTIARKGLTMQRYKGLGEMTAQQLWETTLDRNVRSLLQVKIKDVAEAEDIFVRLMGDVVEPRRAFIQENALSVSNLDV